MKIKHIIWLWGFIALSLYSFIAFGQGYDFVINDYSTTINIQENGDLNITESIDTTFNIPKHGIFRVIPSGYELSGWGYLYTPIVDVDASTHPFTTYKENGYQFIKIGDPDRTIDGRQLYEFDYKVRGWIRPYSSYQELYWNIIWTEWEVPIMSSHFQIIVPFDFAPQGNNGEGNRFVYHGWYGEKKLVSNVQFENNIISWMLTEPLQPREWVTIGLKFENQPFSLPVKNEILRLLFHYWVFLIPLVIAWYCFRTWYSYGRDRPLPDIVSYYPPANLTPPELKLLLTRNCSPEDVTSLLYSRAAKGLIKIEEKEEKSLLGTIGIHLFNDTQYILKNLSGTDQPAWLEDFEISLFKKLFHNRDEINISKATNLYNALEAVCNTLHSRFQFTKYYTPESNKSVRSLRRTVALLVLVFCVVMLTSVYLYEMYFSFFQHQVILDVPDWKWNIIWSGLLCLIIILLFGNIMRAKTRNYEEILSKIRGFRTFIEKVEKPKLQSLLKEDPLFIDKALPYAVVLGLAWSLLRVADESIEWWYHPVRYTWSHLTGWTNISHAISSIANSSWTSAPRSSWSGSFGGWWGFGGGGFSGGGWWWGGWGSW